MESLERTFRWGIIGSGNIARKLVKSSWSVKGCTLVAAASKTEGRAASFCKEWDIPSAYVSYADLVNDPDVDIVYVANTHNFHYESVMMALRCGKHVLCEKPLAINGVQAREMTSAARQNKCFLMEAMWTRFLPAIVQVRRWLKDGLIGNVKQIQASFGINLMHVRRLTDPGLAGGALLDVGIYPLSFASMVMNGQKPAQMHSHVELLDTGVDGSSMIQFIYENGTWADLKCSCLYSLPNDAWIIGDKGRIHIPTDFYSSQSAVLFVDDKETTESFPSERAQLFKYQMQEVQNCISRGELESSIMPLDETVALAETMDQLRRNWGVKYPGE